MKKDDRVYLADILDAIDRIADHLRGVDRSKFLETVLVQDGVIRRLEIIGEASTRISKELRAAYPQVEWGEIISLRNRAIHAYGSLNLEIIWDITQQDLGPLRQTIQTILDELDKNSQG